MATVLNILIVDDEHNMLDKYEGILHDLKLGHNVYTARMGIEACEICRDRNIDLALIDYSMGEMNGIETGRRLRHINPDMILYMLTAWDDHVKEAFQAGFEDYLVKPVDKKTMKTAITWGELQAKQKIGNAKQAVSSKANRVTIQYQSQAMFEIMEIADKSAKTDARVLITGSSGAGKELIAQHIHFSSNRALGPFVELDCSAIPENIIESELFGTVKGAFTNALDRKGLIEESNGGTLFLDEIGDMPVSSQTKLLRVLQEKKVRRVGSNKEIIVDIRVVSATNKNLEQCINEKSFREDLYYRLNVIHIHLPELAGRREDIALLAEHFSSKFAAESNKKLKKFSKAALDILHSYYWPGNVRELENIVETLYALCDTHEIDAQHLPKKLKTFSGKTSNNSLPVDSHDRHQSHCESNVAYPSDFKKITGADFDQTMQYINKCVELIEENPEKSKWELKKVDAHFGSSNNFRTHLLNNPEAYMLILKNNPQLKVIIPILKKSKNIHKKLLQEGFIE